MVHGNVHQLQCYTNVLNLGNKLNNLQWYVLRIKHKQPQNQIIDKIKRHFLKNKYGGMENNRSLKYSRASIIQIHMKIADFAIFTITQQHYTVSTKRVVKLKSVINFIIQIILYSFSIYFNFQFIISIVKI